ncbi:hypothetical protein KQH91_07440 [Lactobacillus johnsonii]|uniref:hypothetical protein n=1 Tax=Lactobacillus johnsonii TaxID=33959 RepID=UPI001C106DEC|nr:hypothetical protein [Lactobacillus johnsonii]MBU5319351.1 hypothetical protein [Lactobacillus johnsonii]MDO5007577.1 hypothetical protein [Lactobacillus johnsonii]
MNDEVLNERLARIYSDQLKINKEFNELDKLETIEQRNTQLSKIALAISRIAKRVKKVLKKSIKLEQTFIKREYKND